jgi:hypothetical protein
MVCHQCKIPCLDFGAHHERYKETLNKLRQGIRRVRPKRDMKDVLLLPDTCFRTCEAIAKICWAFLPHPAPSDCHLFGHVKDALRGRQFAYDNELKQSFVMCSEVGAGNFTVLIYSVLLNVGKVC